MPRYSQKSGYAFPDYDPEQMAFGEAINLLIDRALVAARAVEKPRTYMGGSQAGKPCLRALRYDWEGQLMRNANPTASDPFEYAKYANVTGKMCRRTELGNAHELITATWLRMADFVLVTEDDDGKQLGYLDAWDEESQAHQLAGNIDGRIDDGPIDLPYPLLWEHKIMRSDLWRKCRKVGVQASYPEYYAQLQIYMGYMDLRNALFTGLNTDSSELLFEMVPLNIEYAQWATDRLLDVVHAKSHTEFERIGRTESYWQCSMCKHKTRCWSDV